MYHHLLFFVNSIQWILLWLWSPCMIHTLWVAVHFFESAFPSIDYLSTNKSSIFVFIVDKLAQQIIFAMHKSYSQYIGNSIHWFQKRPMRRHSRPIWQPSRPMRQPIKPIRQPIRPIRRHSRPMRRPIRPIQNRLQHSLQLLLKVLDCLMKTKWLKKVGILFRLIEYIFFLIKKDNLCLKRFLRARGLVSWRWG